MKRRNGHVSNSSSSSFICEISGYEISGYDVSLSDANMFMCDNNHVLCEQYALKDVELDGKKFEEYYDEDYYCIPVEFCPICQLKHISKETVLDYFLTKYSDLYKLDELKSEITNAFPTLIELHKYIYNR